jgi:hypothetical protein
MGRAAYEGMAGALPTADHPFTGILNAARKVVFSRSLRAAEWANTTAAGDPTQEIDNVGVQVQADEWPSGERRYLVRGSWPNSNQLAILAASPRSTAASRHRGSTSKPTTPRGMPNFGCAKQTNLRGLDLLPPSIARRQAVSG